MPHQLEWLKIYHVNIEFWGHAFRLFNDFSEWKVLQNKFSFIINNCKWYSNDSVEHLVLVTNRMLSNRAVQDFWRAHFKLSYSKWFRKNEWMNKFSIKTRVVAIKEMLKNKTLFKLHLTWAPQFNVTLILHQIKNCLNKKKSE